MLDIIKDYDAFLILLERTINEDVSQLSCCGVSKDTQVDQTVVLKAYTEKQEKDLERLEAALVEYYCNQIAKGEIVPSGSSWARLD
jgi:hypothetical protein